MNEPTDNIIDALVADLHPVRPPVRPRVAWLAYAVLAFLVVLVVTGLFGANPHPRLGLLGAAAFAAAGAALFSLRSAFPGLAVPRGWAVTAMFAVTLALLFYGAGGAPAEGRLLVESGLSCFGMSIGVALLPVFFLVWYVRKGAAMRPQSSGMLAGAAGGFFSLTVMELHCANAHPLHLALGHLLPVAALVTAAVYGARRWAQNRAK